MNSSIVSIGLSNPGSPIPQAEIARFMQLAHQLDGQERRKLDFLYRKSGIDFRHSVLDDFQKEDFIKAIKEYENRQRRFGGI